MAAGRKPALDHKSAMILAGEEYVRFTTALKELDPGDWTRATNCPPWDVRAMASHTLGMADMAASPFESRRQIKEAKKRGGNFVDALTSLQVEERADLEPVHIIYQLESAGWRSVKGRRRIPGFLRNGQTLPPEQTDGIEAWSLGYLVDVILTRDTWMHRMDIAQAVGRELELTADHDGVLIDDVVREWASRHGQPYTLVLTGPAGGEWTFGSGGPRLELNPLDFCRSLTARQAAEGLLETQVPF